MTRRRKRKKTIPRTIMAQTTVAQLQTPMALTAMVTTHLVTAVTLTLMTASRRKSVIIPTIVEIIRQMTILMMVETTLMAMTIAILTMV